MQQFPSVTEYCCFATSWITKILANWRKGYVVVGFRNFWNVVKWWTERKKRYRSLWVHGIVHNRAHCTKKQRILTTCFIALLYFNFGLDMLLCALWITCNKLHILILTNPWRKDLWKWLVLSFFKMPESVDYSPSLIHFI